MKKEELVKELGYIKREKDELEIHIEKLRQDMCRVLGFIREENSYGIKEVKIGKHTWAEIHSEIGRLRCLAREKDKMERLEYFEQELFRHAEYISEQKKEK